MAKVKKNIVMKGLSGSLGDQLVVKGGKGGRTIISIKPTFPEDREFSDAQKEHMEDFREAMMYAKDAAKTEAVYAEKAEDTPLSAYNVAIADWFHEPEIGDIDLSGWTGQAGEPIRIRAVDDVKVERVTVVITDAEGVLIEQGAATQEATQEDKLWWVYTTTKPAAGLPKVIAVARDLPGNIAQMEVQTTPVQQTA
jgi:hypothetical protein